MNDDRLEKNITKLAESISLVIQKEPLGSASLSLFAVLKEALIQMRETDFQRTEKITRIMIAELTDLF